MRNYFIVLLLLAAGQAGAQIITGYEYWFNTDDAAGQRVFVPAGNAQSVSLTNLSISLGALPVGHHKLHVRLKDSNDRWSSVITRPISRLSGAPFDLVSGEYWFDTDHGSAVTFTLGPGQVVSANIAPSVTGLQQGPHRVHYRIRDNNGFWSSVITKPFSVTPGAPHEIVLLRYWSDPDATSPDDMTNVPISPAEQYLDLMDDILFCEWSATGNTNVYFQLKDNHAQWSSVVSKSINVDLVSGAPDQPGIIDGLFNPPFNTEQTYTIDSVPGAGAYEWILPDGWSGTSTDTIITVQVGNFNDDGQLCVRAINGCGASVERCLDITTDVAYQSSSGGIGLYPNPNSGQFFLELTSTAQVAVFDASGRQIIAEQLLQGTRHTIDLGDAPGGVYSMRIIQDGRVEVRRFIVQH